MAFMLAIFLALLALNVSLQKVFAHKPATKTEYFVRTLSDVKCVGTLLSFTIPLHAYRFHPTPRSHGPPTTPRYTTPPSSTSSLSR